MQQKPTHALYQRGEDGYPAGADDILRQAYGPIPEAAEFQHGKGGRAVPETVHGWQWSSTFGCWSALVTFADGWEGFTYPAPERSRSTDADPAIDQERQLADSQPGRETYQQTRLF